MTVTDKVKAFMAISNVKGVDLVNALGVSYNAASNRIYKGITRVDDLIKICTACGAEISITAKDGTVFRLTLDDLPQKDAAK